MRPMLGQISELGLLLSPPAAISFCGRCTQADRFQEKALLQPFGVDAV